VLALSDRDQPRASSLDLDAVSSRKVGDVLDHQDAVLDLLGVIELDSNLLKGPQKPLDNRPDWRCPR
jgi:hypothetical protein